jgi:predicted phage terminase large subunit-like protein
VGGNFGQIDDEYIRQLSASLAKDSFFHFIQFVQPEYQFNWHHLVLIEHLQRLAERQFSRLIVMMPPRHGKSQLVSRLFPAWCFARNQNEQVIVAGYSLDLASSMNRDCQKIVTSEKYKELFPDVCLSEGRDTGSIKTSKRFDIVGAKGYYIAAGVGGGITGAGATVGIVDDPVKNAEEADSKTYRDKAHEWYKTTFRTRFEPGAIEVICQTRWHEDDLTGRVIKSTTPGTEIVSFPALAESNEENRDIGQALWEGKYDRKKLLEIKTDVGTRAWNALFQQRPSAEEGGVIKKAWFGRYDPRKYSFSGKQVNFFFDTAYTEDEKNDPMGAIAYVKEGADFYVLDYESAYLEFPEQIEQIKTFCAKNGYSQRSLIRVEPKASGKSVVQVAKRATELNIKEARAPKESKTARANSCSATLEAGRVLLPEGMRWVDDFLTECAAFPNAAHDEAVDCLTGMMLNEGVGRIQIHY